MNSAYNVVFAFNNDVTMTIRMDGDADDVNKAAQQYADRLGIVFLYKEEIE